MMDLEIIEGTPEKITFEWKSFSKEFSELVQKTNGGVDTFSPNDYLVKAWGWVHGNSGFTAQFLWASGRCDAYAVPDAEGEDAKKGFKLIADSFFGTASDSVLSYWDGVKNVA